MKETTVQTEVACPIKTVRRACLWRPTGTRLSALRPPQTDMPIASREAAANIPPEILAGPVTGTEMAERGSFTWCERNDMGRVKIIGYSNSDT